MSWQGWSQPARRLASLRKDDRKPMQYRDFSVYVCKAVRATALRIRRKGNPAAGFSLLLYPVLPCGFSAAGGSQGSSLEAARLSSTLSPAVVSMRRE